MKDKTCLITGATNGIGKAAAVQLAELGTTLVLVGRNPDKTAATVQQIKDQTGNQEIHSLVADLSSLQAIRGLADDFKAQYQRLDVLVNNAGALDAVASRDNRRHRNDFRTQPPELLSADKPPVGPFEVQQSLEDCQRVVRLPS